jgi:glycosyltransferase involved in cell wall biosynthesis
MAPPWKIDFLATAPQADATSGLSRVVWELAAALHARGHTTRVLYPTRTPRAAPEYRGVPGVPVPILGTSRRPFGRDIEAGKNATACLQPDVDIVVGNDEKAGALDVPATARRGARAPVFAMFFHDVALHTFDTLRPLEADGGVRQRVTNWLDRRALVRLESKAIAKARLILVGSTANRDLLGRLYGVPPDHVRVLPMGVPDPVDIGRREDARLELKVPGDVPVVLFVGRTPNRQGLPTALEAFRRIRVFFPGARFLVVGATAPPEPGVVSLGVVDEATKARAFRAADVFLFPTLYEGFGLAPREAMRYGLATVVSPHLPLEGAHPPDDVRVVGSDDPGDYASELAELLADPALRRKIGEAGRKYADQFSYPKMAEHFEEYVAPLVGS